jgi:MFS family permease
MPLGGAELATVLALVGVAMLTLGEVAAGPAAWHLALRGTPAARQGEYQAVFGMSFSLARILGPLIALPLITRFGPAGWVAVAVVMVSAGVSLAVIGSARSTAPLVTATECRGEGLCQSVSAEPTTASSPWVTPRGARRGWCWNVGA